MRIWSGRQAGSGGGGRSRWGAIVPIVCKRCGKMMKQSRDKKGREPIPVCPKCLKSDGAKHVKK